MNLSSKKRSGISQTFSKIDIKGDKMVCEAARVREITTSMIRRMFEVVAEAKKRGIDVISLSIGEPDFDTDERIVELACRAKREGYTHYTSNLGIEELREAIAERYGVDRNEVMVTAGGSEALINASIAFIERNSRVVIPSPNFLSYFVYAKLCEAEIVQIKTHPNFNIDVDALNEVVNKNTSAIFINYPNNPTGVVEDGKTLKAVVEIAEDSEALVISDEIYDQIYYNKKPVNLVDRENVIVINGFSKSLAMTGWRVGFVIARENLIDSMLKVHQVNGVCAPSFAQKAIADAFASGIFDDVTARMRKAFRERRDYLYPALKKIGFKVVKPEGAFYMFPKIPVNINCVEFTEKLVMRGVAVTPGTAFGDGNESYIRVSYASSLNSLKKAVDRMRVFLEELDSS